MRKISSLMLFFLLSTAFALETNLESYNKGDNIIVSLANLSSGSSYVIKGLSSNNKVFSHGFTALSDTYVFNYPLSFLDPSGTYLISASGPEFLESKSVMVNPTRNSSSYLVSFISPLSKSYERTMNFSLDVNVTVAGEALLNATVQSFNDAGERISLVDNGNGIYSVPYNLLINSSLGIKSLPVLVTKAGLGGEGVINITVSSARISIELFEPELNSYSIGSVLSIKFKALYPNSSVVTKGITAAYGTANISLELIDDYYVGSYTLTPSDDGLMTLSINALDAYLNSGVFSKKITGTGLINYYISSNVYYIIALTAVIIIIVYYSRAKVKNSLGNKSLKEKQSELIIKKKKLQNDYYVNGFISKKAYDEEIGKIDEALSIIKEKLKH